MSWVDERRVSIGKSEPRARARALAAGRGRYTDDVVLPRMAYVAFVRSPFAHARIKSLETAAARAATGVIAVLTAKDIDAVCKPMVTRLANVAQHVSAPQKPIAGDEVSWQGEPVAAVVATSRALAEDAAEKVVVAWEPSDPVVDPYEALAPAAPVVNSALSKNEAFAVRIGDKAAVRRLAERAAVTVSHTFKFGRITGVPLETRAIVADFNNGDGTLTVYQSHQSPHLMQQLFADHLCLPVGKVRVIAPDVGGAFGVKLHVYGDEMAAAAISVILQRPVKFICDRMEALQADAHARECQADASLSVDKDGHILAFDASVVSGLGAYSIYPRGSLGEGMQTATFIGAPYNVGALHVDMRFAYQNKSPSGAVRGVGMPLATVITEQLLDFAAHELGIDAAEIRRRNYLRRDQYPLTTKGNLKIEGLSLMECLDRLLDFMRYDELRQEQDILRQRGIYRGIGIATFVEQTSRGAGLYGPTGLPITSQDICVMRVEPTGDVWCQVGCTDQGQGTLTGIAQIVADTLGISYERISVQAGDSSIASGGGAWASRGLTISGEAAYLAAAELRQNLLEVAGAVLQANVDQLDIRNNNIVLRADGASRMSVGDLCRLAYFRQDTLPPDLVPKTTVAKSYIPRSFPYLMSNGIQASYLELDPESGWIRLLGHWAVEDCGRVINPQLVDEQMRGGIVQGIGAALWEHCIYAPDGQLQTSTLADYMVPMADEMPDIGVAHVETPYIGTATGVKGAGEAGTVGASAAIWCAINDVLRFFKTRASAQPLTPASLLLALGKVR